MTAHILEVKLHRLCIVLAAFFTPVLAAQGSSETAMQGNRHCWLH